MRRVAEPSWGEIYTIFFLVYLYFSYASVIRSKSLHPLVISTSAIKTFGFFLLTFTLTVYFFHFLASFLKLNTSKQKLASTFAYSLLPTLLWFFSTSTLFLLFPPPRGENILGLSLSLVFVIVSLSLLLWRLILFYLSLRFATKASFQQILLMMLLFAIWFLPFSFLMYYLDIFRVPFI